MKIAITGANGFVGAALCRYFHERNHEILALGNSRVPDDRLVGVTEYQFADFKQVLSPIDADVCIHAGAISSESDSYQDLIFNNVEGTINVVEAARHCKYFIHISSSSVYNFSGEAVREDDASINSEISDYGETKLLAEDIVEMEIPVQQFRMILRPRAVYGIGDRILLPKLLSLVRGRFLLCPFKKDVKSSLTHVDNIGYAIELFLSQSEPAKIQTFNIADEKPYSLRDLAVECSSKLMKKKLIPVSLPSFLMNWFIRKDRQSELVRHIARPLLSVGTSTVLDLTSITRELKYRPVQSFEKSCNGIADWVNSFGSPAKYLQHLSAITTDSR